MDDATIKSNALRHKFCDLVTISLLCALCGAETATNIEDVGQMKEECMRCLRPIGIFREHMLTVIWLLRARARQGAPDELGCEDVSAA